MSLRSLPSSQHQQALGKLSLSATSQVSPSEPNRPASSRKRPVVFYVFWSVVFVVVLFFSVWLINQSNTGNTSGSGLSLPGFSFPSIPVVPDMPVLTEDRILLLMGVDANPDHPTDPFQGTRTDTMMMVRLNTKRKSLSVVSIPRDSKVYLANGGGVHKINSAHAIGGAEYAVETVEDAFGIPLDNYMVLNYQGVREIVDALDGVDVFVEKPMTYRDRTAKLDIQLEPGKHHLNGQQAEEFLRFRNDAMGDIGRIRRQQYFVSALAKKLRDPWTLAKLPEVVRLSRQYLRTDLSLEELLQLAAFAKDVNLGEMRSAILPGYPSQYSQYSYWVIRPEAASEVLNRLILQAPSSAQEKRNATDNPFKVGVFYDPVLADQLDEWVAQLESNGYHVVCQSKKKQIPTQIIEHQYRLRNKDTERLRGVHPALKSARLIFAPVNTTFEASSCSSSEDYTIFLGQNPSSVTP